MSTRDVPQGKLLGTRRVTRIYGFTRRARVSMTSRAMSSTLLPFWFSCILLLQNHWVNQSQWYLVLVF